MAAFNACIMVGYVAGASLEGHHPRLGSRSGPGASSTCAASSASATRSPPGYEAIDYEVRIKGDGTPSRFEEIHQTVMETSPNYFNMSRPIRMNGTLTRRLISPGPGRLPLPSECARDQPSRICS